MPRIIATFKRPADTSIGFRSTSEVIKPIVQYLQATDQHGKEWLLMGDTEQDSYRHRAFDDTGALTPEAEAVLETASKGEIFYDLATWNGELEKANSASLMLSFNSSGWPSWNLEIDYPESILTRLNGYDGLYGLLNVIARTVSPSTITVARSQYVNHQVFPDRAGVGWMLYLPRVLTTQQVPEARALVPVMDPEGKEQIGTIIVSEIEEPFDYKNPEHVKVANQIEIRLADQDLLPRFVDL